MDQQGEQRRAHDDPGRPGADGRQDAVDDRVEHARVAHDPEEEDREYEHADDGGEALEASQDELACVESEPADQSRGNRDDDQRDERRHALRHDDHKQQHNRCQAEQRKHYSLPENEWTW